ncbi:hypothetical protein OESDEN_18036 [Oesophagostomum dentatum]|uniref:Uncharacterized protein n=1 Tax=Oesophagostomum dentatum TaxID=61180 RepID=A0A0B1SFF6_OESDE|nr:hypothetical protein OESDEN_18036 [Oesophagostomum dentatum]
MSSADQCTRQRWDIKMALNGLHLRRAELARDCVQKNIQDATISESILNAEQLQTCRSIHAKFPFAPGNKRRKRSMPTSKADKKRNSRQKVRLVQYRSATFLLYLRFTIITYYPTKTE